MKSLLSKDEKTKLLETFRSFDQTQTAFAEVNGINPKTLAGWIYQQRLEARQNQNNVEFVGLEADNSKNQTMLNEKIISAKEEIAAINAELKRIPFGRDIYQFKMEEKSDRAVFFTICKNLELYSESPDLFTERTVSDEQLADDVQSFLNKILDTEQEEDYSDYRNYFTYDMTIRSHIGDEESEMDLSKKQGSASGGEKQTPYFIVLAASLMQFYPKDVCCARIAFIDEAFSALSKERIEQ